MFFVKSNEITAKESIFRCNGPDTDHEHLRSGSPTAWWVDRPAGFGVGLLEIRPLGSFPAPRGNPHLTLRRSDFREPQEGGSG